MNEVEKMYKLANIKAINIAEYGSTYIPNGVEIDGKLYPPFTAEKQIELIKWLTKNDKFHCLEIEFFIKEKDYKISTYQKASNFNKDFTETLASLINNLWQDLTDAEKTQIKEILE